MIPTTRQILVGSAIVALLVLPAAELWGQRLRFTFTGTETTIVANELGLLDGLQAGEPWQVQLELSTNPADYVDLWIGWQYEAENILNQGLPGVMTTTVDVPGAPNELWALATGTTSPAAEPWSFIWWAQPIVHAQPFYELWIRMFMEITPETNAEVVIVMGLLPEAFDPIEGVSSFADVTALSQLALLDYSKQDYDLVGAFGTSSIWLSVNSKSGAEPFLQGGMNLTWDDIEVNVIPEPGTATMALLALGLLTIWRAAARPRQRV